VKAESGGSVEEPGKEPGSVQQEARTCPVCGTKFSAAGDSDFCPVCILRGAPSGESTAAGWPALEHAPTIPVAKLVPLVTMLAIRKVSAYVPTAWSPKEQIHFTKAADAAVPGSPAESAPSFPKTLRRRAIAKAQTRQVSLCNLPEKSKGRWGLGITPAVMKRCHWVKLVLVAQLKFTGSQEVS
jgi:hypothetical protein